MKIKFHHEIAYKEWFLVDYPSKRYMSERAGLIILEEQPHFRTMKFNTNSYDRQTFFRVKLPHVIFVIQYCTKNNHYIYNGLYHSGLAVVVAEKSLKSINDEIWLSPTETNCVSVCTPHQLDGKKFNSIKELIYLVTNTWYGLEHRITKNRLLDWKDKNIFQIYSKRKLIEVVNNQSIINTELFKNQQFTDVEL